MGLTRLRATWRETGRREVLLLSPRDPWPFPALFGLLCLLEPFVPLLELLLFPEAASRPESVDELLSSRPIAGAIQLPPESE